MKILDKIINDLRNGENIENYLIISLALIIIILDIFNIGNGEWTTEVTLAILALLAYGRINDQKKLERIEQKVSSTSNIILKKYPDTLEEDIRQTPELWLVGITLNRTTNTHYSLFKKKLEQGHKIRVILVTPKSSASEMAAIRDRRSRKKAWYDKTIKHTLGDFCELLSLTKGDLELRTINAALSFGYYAMTPTTPEGKIYLEHYGFKSEAGDVPKMVLREFDGYLYEAFKSQLFILWEHAVPWECGSDEAQVESSE